MAYSAKQFLLTLILWASTTSPFFAAVEAAGCADQTSCSSCLSAPPSSPGVQSCTWFEDLDYCEEGCGMDGCGASICAADAATCEDCLGFDASGQYSWVPATGTCVADNSCNDPLVPADAACFGGSAYDESICSEAGGGDGPTPPIELQGCASATSCAGCMAAVPESSADACTWFEDIGYCEEGCGMEGCGATQCAESIRTCAECLTSDDPSFSQWSWVPGTNTCVASCSSMDVPADAACFAGGSYGVEVCPTCDEYTTCDACLGNGCSYSEGGCYDSCSDPMVPADGSCFDGNIYDSAEVCPAPLCEDMSTCDACLGNGCSYSEGDCYDSCSDPMVPADGSCFDGNIYDSAEVCPPPPPPPPPPMPMDAPPSADGMDDMATNSSVFKNVSWVITTLAVATYMCAL